MRRTIRPRPPSPRARLLAEGGSNLSVAACCGEAASGRGSPPAPFLWLLRLLRSCAGPASSFSGSQQGEARTTEPPTLAPQREAYVPVA
jgi:hypothetical protein